MEYIVAAVVAGFAMLILVALFRRPKPRADAPGSTGDPFSGVQRYAGQGDLVGVRGDTGHHGAGEAAGGDDGGSD